MNLKIFFVSLVGVTTRPGKRKDPENAIDGIGPAVPAKERNVDTAGRVQAITTVPKEDTAKFLKKLRK